MNKLEQQPSIEAVQHSTYYLVCYSLRPFFGCCLVGLLPFKTVVSPMLEIRLNLCLDRATAAASGALLST